MIREKNAQYNDYILQIEYHLMKNSWMMFLNVFLHAGNTLSCLIDIFLTAR